LCLTFGALRAGTALHDAAFLGMAQAPAAFFATNPAGRILNRFLSDVGTVDGAVRTSVSALAMIAFQFVGAVVVIAATTPLVVPVLAALGFVYYRLARGYRLAARDLRRMQSVARSPVIASSFSETLRGLATVRAFGPAAAAAFLRRHLVLSREYGRAFLAYWGANEYISTWLEGIGVLVISAATVLSVLEHQRGNLSTAAVGLLLSFVLQMPGTLMWFIRAYTQVEIDAVSIERMVEYAELTDEETVLRQGQGPQGGHTVALSAAPAAAEGAAAETARLSAVVVDDPPLEAGAEAAAAEAEAEVGAVAGAEAGAGLRRASEAAEVDLCRASEAAEVDLCRASEAAEVDLCRVWLRYGPGLPDVLRGLDLRVPRGAKVALLGRSGAGKSTVMQALMRLYPFHGGEVRVCGDSAAAVPAAALRAHVTALLQDGWLFAGTLRENLLGPDAATAAAVAAALPPPSPVQRRSQLAAAAVRPASIAPEISLPRMSAAPAHAALIAGASVCAGVGPGCFEEAESLEVRDGAGGTEEGSPLDPELWAVLHRVSLAAAIRALPGGLDSPVSEGGGNWSAGERALLCLARALLHRRLHGTRVVLCDEPTASVDLAADAVVHETILGLPDTVLCICHRLRYVPRFDLVAVVDGGRVVELGPPAVLRSVAGSHYARLLEAAAESATLPPPIAS